MQSVYEMRVSVSFRLDCIHAQHGRLAIPAPGPPQPLSQCCDRPWRADLPYACHVADVDSEFQGRSTDRRDRQVPPLEPLLNEVPMLP